MFFISEKKYCFRVRELTKITSKIGHWLHFGLSDQLELEVWQLIEYYKEALEIEKAYFMPLKGGNT